jgi:hypothetical protein
MRIFFSKSEIFNELMDFFQNTNKSDTISEWFFKDKTENMKKTISDHDRSKYNHAKMQKFAQEFSLENHISILEKSF